MAKIGNIFKSTVQVTWKGNQHGFGTAKRTLRNGAGKPLKEHDLYSSQPRWNLNFDHLLS